MSHDRERQRGLRRILPQAMFALGTVAAAGLVAAALHGRAGPVDSLAAPGPLPVAAEIAREVPGYVEIRRLAGRIEPARQTAVAFERGGLIVGILVEEGEAVAAAAPLARLDTAQLITARTRLEALRAQRMAAVELARLTYTRQQKLSDRTVTAQRLDEARLELAAAEAALAATGAELRGVAIDLEKSVLRAPFAGTVAARALHEGTVTEAGRPVLTVLEDDRPRARIGVPADLAAELALGTRWPVEVAGAVLPARLVALRPDPEPGSRTVTALFELEAPVPAPLGTWRSSTSTYRAPGPVSGCRSLPSSRASGGPGSSTPSTRRRARCGSAGRRSRS